MNKEYTYIDGKVIVEDENGNKKVREYNNKLDEILIQENIIEAMENQILILEEESKYYKKNNSKRYIPIILPVGLLTIIIAPSVILSLAEGANVFTTMINTIFGPMSKVAVFTLAISVPLISLVSMFELAFYTQHRDSQQKEKGVNSELEFLKKQIIIEKEKLASLQKEKIKKEEKKEFKVVKVDDLQTLQALKNSLCLYFDLGYNGEKYYKYYLQGKLDRKLDKYYNDTGIEIAREYLGEKGPQLIKRK